MGGGTHNQHREFLTVQRPVNSQHPAELLTREHPHWVRRHARPTDAVVHRLVLTGVRPNLMERKDEREGRTWGRQELRAKERDRLLKDVLTFFFKGRC